MEGPMILRNEINDFRSPVEARHQKIADDYRCCRAALKTCVLTSALAVLNPFEERKASPYKNSP